MPRMRTTLLTPFVATACAAVLLSGCSAFSSDASPSGEVRVAASFYPLAYVAERVGGSDVTVTNLTRPGGEPHDLELTAAQTAEIAQAELVVVEDGFQPAVDDAVRQNATGEVIDAAELTSNGDPHFWVDPLLLAELGDQVAAELAELDGEHADAFQERAQDLRAELEELDEAYRTGLAQCERSTVVVSHDAFSYLERYGLEFEPIAGLSPDAEPTPADLGRLQKLVKEEGITTVFSERLVSPRLAETLADEAGVSTAVLDPIEGLSDETGSEDYQSLAAANLEALRTANGCS